MYLLGCIRLVDNIDPKRHANSCAQRRPRELTVVGSGYKSVTRDFNLTRADAQLMHFTERERTETGPRRSEPRQLQECPASEQAG
jgi:hypothetical protein